MPQMRFCGRWSMRGWRARSIVVAEFGRELGGCSSATTDCTRTARCASGTKPAGPPPFKTWGPRSARRTAAWGFALRVRISASGQLALAAPVPQLGDEARGHRVEAVLSSDLIDRSGELSQPDALGALEQIGFPRGRQNFRDHPDQPHPPIAAPYVVKRTAKQGAGDGEDLGVQVGCGLQA